MVQNSDTCYIMCVGKDTENETFIFDIFMLNNSDEEKILGITNENKLIFKSYIKLLCKRASQKIGTLSRILDHLSGSLRKFSIPE